MGRKIIPVIVLAALVLWSCGKDADPRDPYGIIKMSNDESFQNKPYLLIFNVELPSLVCTGTKISVKFDFRAKISDEERSMTFMIGDSNGKKLHENSQAIKKGDSIQYADFITTNSSDYYIFVFENDELSYIYPLRINQEENEIVSNPVIRKVWYTEFGMDKQFYAEGYNSFLSLNISEKLPCEIKNVRIFANVTSRDFPYFIYNSEESAIDSLKNKENIIIDVCVFASEGQFANDAGKNSTRRTRAAVYGLKGANCVRNIGKNAEARLDYRIDAQGAGTARGSHEFSIWPDFSK